MNLSLGSIKSEKPPPAAKKDGSLSVQIGGRAVKESYFEPTLGRRVSVPKGYGRKYCNWEGIDLEQLRQSSTVVFCSFCNLKPCIAIEQYPEISMFTAELEPADRRNAQSIWKKLDSVMMKKMELYYGERCAKRMGLPKCVVGAIRKNFPYRKNTPKAEWDETILAEFDPSDDSSSCSSSLPSPMIFRKKRKVESNPASNSQLSPGF